jgi:uncharacterized protein (DUF58 family)
MIEAADWNSIAAGVRRLEIQVRRSFAGEGAGFYESVRRGRGLAFEEVRAYSPGDDVRSLDAKTTARMGVPYVKRFAEERERTVRLFVDTSASMNFGGPGRSKQHTALEAAAVLALSAAAKGDQVGMSTFGGSSSFIAPGRGRRHGLRLLRELVRPASAQGATFADAVERLLRYSRPRELVFVISDFLDFADPADLARRLAPLAHGRQLFALHVVDPLEQAMPAGWMTRWCDAETGTVRIIDAGSARFREAFARQAIQRQRQFAAALRQFEAPWITLPDDQPALRSLWRHFRRGAAQH